MTYGTSQNYKEIIEIKQYVALSVLTKEPVRERLIHGQGQADEPLLSPT
jgi:hypothetical protein